MLKRFSFLTTFVVLSLALMGCPPKKKLKIEEPTPTPTPEASLTPEDPNALQPGDIQVTKDWTESPALTPIYFDYDSSQLSEGQRATLKKNIAVLKKLPASIVIRVEGHCDDRGTTEYNLALGQQRANAVASFYKTSGIAKARVQTISYGEERPTCTAETEACWSMNRRGSTTLKSDTPVIIRAKELQ